MSEIDMEKGRKEEPWQRPEHPSYLDVKQHPSNKSVRVTTMITTVVGVVTAIAMLVTHHFGWFMLALFITGVIDFAMYVLVRDTAAGTREGKSRPAALDMYTPDATTDTAIANMSYGDAAWLSRRPNDP